jgi:tRNA nucleotidyltransferase/poly(A) polymerase
MDWKLQHPALTHLLAAFRQEYAPVYVVGGAVRDLLLDRQPKRPPDPLRRLQLARRLA